MDGLMPNFYFLAKCVHCGFVYANTPATRQDYQKYYTLHNRYSTLPTQDSSCLKIYETVFGLIKKYIDKDNNVLDVGCGNGEMLKFMKQDGYKYLTGLDPALTNIDKLRKANLRGFEADIYDEPIGDLCGQFDAIIVSGVLEHLYDLKSAMTNLTLYLKPGGKILCFVPNALEYYLYASPMPHYINIEHINHFSPNILVKLFSDYGFAMLECVNTTIDFGSMLDPTLLGAFEYTNIIDIASQKISNMLVKDELEQRRINDLIADLVKSKENVAIFGTGNYARTLMSSTNLKDALITCFIDNDISMHGKDFCGFQVNPPNYLQQFDGKVIVLSMHGFETIERQLRNMGLKNIICLPERVIL